MAIQSLVSQTNCQASFLALQLGNPQDPSRGYVKLWSPLWFSKGIVEWDWSTENQSIPRRGLTKSLRLSSRRPLHTTTRSQRRHIQDIDIQASLARMICRGESDCPATKPLPCWCLVLGTPKKGWWKRTPKEASNCVVSLFRGILVLVWQLATDSKIVPG